MTHHKDPITTAARLLREAADEYADGIRINGEPDWANEPETHAAYLENMEAAQALDDLADSLGAGGVSPLRRPQCLHQISEPPGLADVSKEQYARMFGAACEALGQISDHLGIDSDIDPGAEPIIGAIKELQATTQWRPIATAPRDGTRILLATRTGRIADGDFHRGVWAWPYVMTEPTHWMPMPTPPSTPGAPSFANEEKNQ